jgi:hypothetical protein
MRCPDQGCIEDGAFESLLHDLRPFLDQALHACAFLVFRTLIERLEYLFDSRNVSFGLFQVPSKP